MPVERQAPRFTIRSHSIALLLQSPLARRDWPLGSWSGARLSAARREWLEPDLDTSDTIPSAWANAARFLADREDAMNARILSYQPDTEFFIDEQCYINELSNSDSDPSLSIAKARVKPGVSTHWHALKGTVERYVILSGTGRVDVGELPAQDIGPHDVVIIPAGCRQRITNTGAEDLVFLALCSPRFDAACYQEL